MSADPVRVAQLEAEARQLRMRLDAASAALLAERFRDVPRYSSGQTIQVPRKLFGKIVWWPARIAVVHLDYSSGTSGNGESWEQHLVSYTVFLRQKDGSFGGSSEGYYHEQVQQMPDPARQESE